MDYLSPGFLFGFITAISLCLGVVTYTKLKGKEAPEEKFYVKIVPVLFLALGFALLQLLVLAPVLWLVPYMSLAVASGTLAYYILAFQIIIGLITASFFMATMVLVWVPLLLVGGGLLMLSLVWILDTFFLVDQNILFTIAALPLLSVIAGGLYFARVIHLESRAALKR